MSLTLCLAVIAMVLIENTEFKGNKSDAAK